MSLFSKKKPSKSYVDMTDNDNYDDNHSLRKPTFVALGGYDDRCNENYKNIKAALEELKIDEKVVRINNLNDIAKYGTMQVPGFAVQGRLMSEGRVISTETAKSLIIKSGFLNYRYY